MLHRKQSLLVSAVTTVRGIFRASQNQLLGAFSAHVRSTRTYANGAHGFKKFSGSPPLSTPSRYISWNKLEVITQRPTFIQFTQTYSVVHMYSCGLWILKVRLQATKYYSFISGLLLFGYTYHVPFYFIAVWIWLCTVSTIMFVILKIENYMLSTDLYSVVL